MVEETPNGERPERGDSKRDADNPATGSDAAQAKEREREMEESGEENAA